MQGAGSRAR
jgi:hypothetical protein